MLVALKRLFVQKGTVLFTTKNSQGLKIYSSRMSFTGLNVLLRRSQMADFFWSY